jgi:hypothetical protein
MTSLTCDDNPGVQVASVTIGLGETKTCTFVNDDISPTITLEKVILNGPSGTATQDDFQALLNDGSVPWDTSQDVLANQGHKIGEAGLTDDVNENYEFVGITGHAKCPTELNGNTDNLDLDEHITCTITNRRKAKITIIKEAVPDDHQNFEFGITDQVSFGEAFELDDNENMLPDNFDGDRPKSKEYIISTGTILVFEYLPNGLWELSDISCQSTVGGSSTFAYSLNYLDLVGIVEANLAIGDEVECTFRNEKPLPTKTQGFWKTHKDVTTKIFTDPDDKLTDLPEIGFIDELMYIGNVSTGLYKTINNESDLFGAYFSSIPKNDDRSKRTKVNKARMQLVRQLVTAKLNCMAFGCHLEAILNITLADDAFSDGDITEIRKWADVLDEYNNSGDTDPAGLPYDKGRATPRDSKNLAKMDDNDAGPAGGIAYWDVLPGPP